MRIRMPMRLPMRVLAQACARVCAFLLARTWRAMCAREDPDLLRECPWNGLRRLRSQIVVLGEPELARHGIGPQRRSKWICARSASSCVASRAPGGETKHIQTRRARSSTTTYHRHDHGAGLVLVSSSTIRVANQLGCHHIWSAADAAGGDGAGDGSLTVSGFKRARDRNQIGYRALTGRTNRS